MQYTTLGACVAQVAIAWLLARDAVTSVLIGATKLKQLEENLGAVRLALSSTEIAELDAATALAPAYPSWFIDNLVDQPAAQALARKEA